MVSVAYTSTFEDLTSGIGTLEYPVLIDEYGELDKTLSQFSGTTSVEAWCHGNDKNGRTYTFRLTVYDRAGNRGSVDSIVTVIK